MTVNSCVFVRCRRMRTVFRGRRRGPRCGLRLHDQARKTVAPSARVPRNVHALLDADAGGAGHRRLALVPAWPAGVAGEAHELAVSIQELIHRVVIGLQEKADRHVVIGTSWGRLDRTDAGSVGSGGLRSTPMLSRIQNERPAWRSRGRARDLNALHRRVRQVQLQRLPVAPSLNYT